MLLDPAVEADGSPISFIVSSSAAAPRRPTAASIPAATAPTARSWRRIRPSICGVRDRRERHQLVAGHVAAAQRALQRVPDPASATGTPARRPCRSSPRSSPAPCRRWRRRSACGCCLVAGQRGGPVAAGCREACGRARRSPRRRSSRPARRTARSRARRRRASATRPRTHGAHRTVTSEPDRVVPGSPPPGSASAARRRGSARGTPRATFSGVSSAAKRLAFLGPEQRAGERAVGVGQRDHHRRAARPDVQRAGIERELAVARRDRQLLVAVRQEVLVRSRCRR